VHEQLNLYDICQNSLGASRCGADGMVSNCSSTFRILRKSPCCDNKNKAINRGARSFCGTWFGKFLRPILAPMGKNKGWLVNGLKWRLESFSFLTLALHGSFAVCGGLKAARKYKQTWFMRAPPNSTLIYCMDCIEIIQVLSVDLRDLWIDNPLNMIVGIQTKLTSFRAMFCRVLRIISTNAVWC